MRLYTLAASLVLTTAAIAQPATQTLTGTVTDSMCGAHHMMQNVSAAVCTRTCIKAGSHFALVVGNKLYTLTGDQAQLDKLAGQTVTLHGTVSGSTVAVSSIGPRK